MKKVLVVVDMQEDFITGSLGNDDCRAAVKGCVDLCNSGEFRRIIFTRDTHDEHDYMDSLEGQKLPVKHCIRLTDGWQIIPELLPFANNMSSRILDKPTFGCEDLPGMIVGLTLETHDPFELHFCGVCTSICVLANMVLCRAAFPNTRIVLHTKATGDVTEEMKQAAFVVAKSQQCDLED